MNSLPPSTVKQLQQLHETFAEMRRRLREGIDVTDKHITIVLRILNDHADQKGLDHMTRKFWRAITDIEEQFQLYEANFVNFSKPKSPTPPSGGAA